MVSRRSLLYSCIVLAPCLVSAASTCTGIFKTIASDLSSFQLAESYCSSKYPIPAATNTVTASTTATITSTISTTTTTATVATTTTTVIAPQVTSSTTVSTNTISITVSTETDTATSTETDTATTTTTFTTVEILKKRNLPTPATSSKPGSTSASVTSAKPVTSSKPITTSTPAATTSKPVTTSKPATTTSTTGSQSSIFSSVLSQASSFIGSVCTCIETQVTTTTTTTPSTTISVTATSTSSVTETDTTTTTPTTTISITATSTVSATVTTTITVSTTTTTTTTITATATAAPRGPSCQNPTGDKLGEGGCSSNCYCDSRSQAANSLGVCDTAQTCGTICNSDNDCLAGQACAKGGFFAQCPGGTSCVDYAACSSSYTPSSRRAARDFLAVMARGSNRERDGAGAISWTREQYREELAASASATASAGA